MKVILIRHGATMGNQEKRYIGITDEALCDTGIEKLLKNVHKDIYPAADNIYVSPMKRCIQTAQIIYPGRESVVVDDLKECDFGRFEGKNYIELSGDSYYQKWIDSNATLPFPKGEDVKAFRKRCTEAFIRIVKHAKDNESVALVVHGGTIMSILSGFYGGSYYDYHCGNAEGYICEVTLDARIISAKKVNNS